jgi:hypothetical protein
MKYRILCVALMAHIVAGSCLAAGEDWQYWSDHKIAWKMTDNTAWVLTPGARYSDDMSETFYNWIALNHVHKWGKGWSSIVALQADELKNSSGRTDNQYGILGAVYSCKACDLNQLWSETCKFRVQGRVFYRLDGSGGDTEFDMFRPRVFISEKLGPITATLSDELRFDMTHSESRESMYKNRVFLTGSKKISKNISVIIGLVRESNHKNNSWTHANGMITKLVVTL